MSALKFEQKSAATCMRSTGPAAFVRRDEGSMSYAALLTAVIMAITMGVGIDAAYSELRRTKMQHTLDQATLAAANPFETRQPKAVINDHLDTMGVTHAVNVSGNATPFQRRAAGHGEVRSMAIFSQFMGVNTLITDVASEAAFSTGGAEIALTLDISGSMHYNSRFPKMKAGAKDFLDAVLGADQTSPIKVTILPFTGSVNLGRRMVDYLRSTNADPSSLGTDYGTGCLEIAEAEFDVLGLPPEVGTLPHFTYYGVGGEPGKIWGWCANDTRAQAQYALSDGLAARQFIDNLPLADGTGGDIAMKNALALLAPEAHRAINHVLSLTGDASRTNGHPAAWDDTNVAKYIVYMSDGDNTNQFRPTDPLNPDHATVALGTQGSSAYTVLYDNSGDRRYFESDAANRRFLKQCDMAKAQGVTICTIAFETSDEMAGHLAACASSPSHTYHMQGDEIGIAFNQIAGSILRQEVRLIQ